MKTIFSLCINFVKREVVKTTLENILISMKRFLFFIFIFFPALSAIAQVDNNSIYKHDSIRVAIGQKEQYDYIMNRVTERLLVNYDSIRLLNERYSEFAYIDSTKEIINAVQINALKRGSGVPGGFSKSNQRNNLSLYFLSGTMYEKHSDYGYATLMHVFSSGKLIPYATEEIDLLHHLLLSQNGPYRSPLYNSPCATSTRLRESITLLEVKDSIYREKDCYLLKTTSNELYTFDENDFIGEPESLVQKRKEVTGNWSPLYQKVISTTIVNKSDYAILKWSRSVDFTNDYNDHRSFFLATEYEKQGNHYFQTHYEYRYPRYFSLVDQKAGFNDKDMYSLIVRDFSDAHIDENMEKELGISKMKKMQSDMPYEKFLKRESTVNDDIQAQWDDYWRKQ
jgi:hypothetical protein